MFGIGVIFFPNIRAFGNGAYRNHGIQDQGNFLPKTSGHSNTERSGTKAFAIRIEKLSKIRADQNGAFGNRGIRDQGIFFQNIRAFQNGAFRNEGIGNQN